MTTGNVEREVDRADNGHFRELEAMMGRPKELTEDERAELLANGFKPVEIWVLDWENPAVLERMKRECQAINDSDRRAGELDYLDEVTSDLWDDFPA